MLNNIINQYKNYPHFSHKITTIHHAPVCCLPAYDTQTLLINYNLDGVYTSRFYRVTSLNPGEFQFSTGLTYQISNLDTGEIIGEFYGFNNPDFIDFIDRLISNGVRFKITDRKFGGTPTNLYHGRYKMLKSGKWSKRK